MYKVFINNKEINFLAEKPGDICQGGLVYDKEVLNDITQKLAVFEASKNYETLYIYGDDPEKLFEKFAANFKIIEAAGGVVKNSNNDLLFIFRNGKWDLPKGQIEQNETAELAAIREVKEECGLTTLEITTFIAHTYHIYHKEDQLVLKRTRWYEMSAGNLNILKPQTEEGIDQAKWVSTPRLYEIINNTYASLENLLEEYLN